MTEEEKQLWVQEYCIEKISIKNENAFPEL